jgi:hypothetical protein
MPSSSRTAAASLRSSSALNLAERFDRLEPRLLLAADVLTWHNNNQRTGANLAESVLTPATVNAKTFGKLGQAAVDGQVYAQPLIKTGVVIPSRGVHDVVYVATEHDTVYAFDARTLAPLWYVNFTDRARGVTTVPNNDLGFDDISPEVGITSTPVIDPATSAIYVVAMTKQTTASGIEYSQTLHALDLATGAEKLGGPVVLQASVPGTGAGSVHGMVRYQARYQNQRPALLLDQGTVYIASASYGDLGPYHGWMLGYDARTLRLTSAFNATPNGIEGGIWMSGAGPAADPAGAIYLGTGNGSFHPKGDPGDFGDSILKLVRNRTGQLVTADSFTPSNQATLDADDLDLGAGGVVLVPNAGSRPAQLLVTAGKDGRILLLNRKRLGGYTSHDAEGVQEIPRAVSSSFGTPAYFQGTVYYVGAPIQVKGQPIQATGLQAFNLIRGKLQTTPTSAEARFDFPGATPSISANGTKNGIVWVVTPNGHSSGRPAVLIAYDASNVHRMLYQSSIKINRDRGGPAVKFAVPTVANGRVYVGGNGTLTLYGVLPRTAARSGSRALIGHR